MIAKLVKVGDRILLLCTDGSISIVDPPLMKRFLTEFKYIDEITGNTNMRWGSESLFTENSSQYKLLRKNAITDFIGDSLAYVTEQKTLQILNPIIFQDVFAFSSPDEYLTTKEYSTKHNVTEGRIKKLCQEGRLPGAIRKGHQWFIPRTARYPEDRRIKWRY